jgi:hypothetical protein
MAGKWRYVILGFVCLVVLISGSWLWRWMAPYGRIGTTYIARQYCSCVFVSARSEASCRRDLAPDVKWFDIITDHAGSPERGQVKARLALFSARATYKRGFGCAVAK